MYSYRCPFKARSDVRYFDRGQAAGEEEEEDEKESGCTRGERRDTRDNVTGLFSLPPIHIMINAAGAVARRMPSAARRSGCWIAWCQAVLLGVSALVIVAERSACKWA